MIYTVCGKINKSDMGPTLSHEHFKWESNEEFSLRMYFERKYNEQEIESDFERLVPVIKELYKLSCRTIVEASPPIGGQNLKLLKRLSEETKVNIVPCTGWNVNKSVYKLFPNKFREQLAKRWVSDFNEGLDVLEGTIIRPGYIKLLLDRGKISEVDIEMIKAAIIASKETGMPIHCHILEAEMVYSVIELLEGENADFSKFLWAHADKEKDLETIKYAASKGMWIGIDTIHYGEYKEYIELLKNIINSGIKDKLLLSQDYDFIEEMDRTGNIKSCISFFDEFIPYCLNEGFDVKTISDIIVSNPAEYYNIP
ncbi:hypothetical protein KHQ82_03445 [Mycoplasmatota bacterium]|nr:hypothetical protein KHQ82_03445 [Mycoplasmatota bacterium]